MNIPLVKKYKKEFEHWLNSGSVIKLSEKDGCTQLGARYEWNDEDEVFIINDKYIHLRVAAAEGKTIQVQRTSSADVRYWDDLNMTSSSDFENRELSDWRIKPVASVGEYAVDTRYDDVHKLVEEKGVIKVLDLKTLEKYPFDERYYVKWKPKNGEYCIMLGEWDDSFTVQRYYIDQNPKWIPIPYVGPVPR